MEWQFVTRTHLKVRMPIRTKLLFFHTYILVCLRNSRNFSYPRSKNGVSCLSQKKAVRSSIRHQFTIHPGLQIDYSYVQATVPSRASEAARFLEVKETYGAQGCQPSHPGMLISIVHKHIWSNGDTKDRKFQPESKSLSIMQNDT